MTQAQPTGSEHVQALPKLGDAARMIGLDASGITRAIQRLAIEPLRWGGRDKHLRIADVLRIGATAQRASLEESRRQLPHVGRAGAPRARRPVHR